MTNDVVLSAALRSNLLSLQNTQNEINTHQNRLATGKKVNSALDNPQSFFAAQSLTNRANDLSNLLDSIGQSIQVINAANNGVTALTSLVTQAQSIANSAQSTLAGASTQATVTGNTNLGTAKLTTLSGITAGDNITFTVTDPTSTTGGFDLGAGGTGDHGTNAVATNVITIGANDTASDLVNKINDLNTGLTVPVISASLDNSGHLTLTAVNGGSLNAKFIANTPGQAANTATANALGFSGVATFNQQGAVATTGTVDFTQTAKSTLSSSGLYTAVGTLAQASTLVSALKDSTGTALTAFTGTTDTLTLSVGGKLSGNLLGASTATTTVQSVIDAINHDATISSLVSASFNTTTGQISLTPLTAAATDVKFSFNTSGTGGAGDKLSLGFGINSLTPGAASAVASEDIRFGAAAGTLQSLQTQYGTVLTQIDSLVNDTGYAGTNLLNGNNLTTYFNETRTSSLVTSGSTFNSAGLGLTAANFQSSAAISTSVSQTQAALTTVRNFGSTLANNLSVIQNRQTFTNSLINTLQTGSDALTNADQNAEGASLLALQTRQSLGITSLSLASQSQQAILKLFP